MLITTQAVWAAPMPGIAITPSAETPSFFQIEIPEDLASVEEVFEAPASLDPKVILHIQNVHGNYQAQVQVKKMLDYFYKNYGFKIIFCEGAAEKLDSKYLELFPDKKDNLALADQLAKKGQLTGPELYLMDAPKDVQAIGVEQMDLYRGNYEAFKEVYKLKKSTDSFLKLLDSRLELLSSRFLTRDLRRILSEWQKFHQGRREFMPFVKHLADEAQKFLNLDLNSLFAQVEWPQTARLLVLQSMEADLKQDEALAERDKLVVFLKEHKASETLITGLQKMEEKTISLQRLAMGKGEDPFQPRKLLERLAEEAVPMGFQFHQYPHFSLYAGYTILESELDSKVLFQEIEKLFDRILESLTVSEKEKNLLELYKDLELLKKLVALELTRTEWDQATYRKNWIKPKSLVERFDKMSASGFVTENLVVTKQIPIVFDAAFSFYEFARQREFAFYDTIEHEMNTQKADRAILVTGGFHTDGLSDIFRSKQINYGILTPRMGGDFDKKNYIQSMMESNPTIFDLAQLEMRAKLGSSIQQIQLGGNPARIMEELLDAYRNHFEGIAHGDTVKPRDTAALAAMINHLNQSLEFHAEGRGFQPLISEDGSYQYWFRTITSVSDKGVVKLGPLVNRKGQVITFTLSSNFKVSQALVLDRVILEAVQAKADGPVEREFNIPRDRVAIRTLQKSVIINSRDSRVRATSGGVGQFNPASRAFDVELPNLNGVYRASLGGQAVRKVTDSQSRFTFPSDEAVVAADRVLTARQGKTGAVNVLAVNVLTNTVHSLEDFFLRLSILTPDAAALDQISIAGTARELAGLPDGIPERHAAFFETIFAPADEPVAEVIRLSENYSKADLVELAEILQTLFGLNKKLYVELLVSDKVTAAELETLRNTVFANVKGIRFNLSSHANHSAASVSRGLVSKMQRSDPSLPRVSVYRAIDDFYVQAEDQILAGVVEDWRGIYGKLLADFDPDSVNASPKIRRALLKLRVSLAAKIPLMRGSEFNEKLAALLTQLEDDEKILSLNGAAVSLVASLVKVLEAYKAKVEKLGASA